MRRSMRRFGPKNRPKKSRCRCGSDRLHRLFAAAGTSKHPGGSQRRGAPVLTDRKEGLARGGWRGKWSVMGAPSTCSAMWVEGTWWSARERRTTRSTRPPTPAMWRSSALTLASRMPSARYIYDLFFLSHLLFLCVLFFSLCYCWWSRWVPARYCSFIVLLVCGLCLMW